jgi:hypothetical protein
MAHENATFARNPRSGVKFNQGRQMKSSVTNHCTVQKAAAKLISKQPRLSQAALQKAAVKNNKAMVAIRNRAVIQQQEAVKELL